MADDFDRIVEGAPDLAGLDDGFTVQISGPTGSVSVTRVDFERWVRELADAEAWAAARVPTAEQVKQALDDVTTAANSIPGSKPANVTTNADEVAGKINNLISRMQSIPSPVAANVRFTDSLIYSQAGLDAKYGGGKAYGGTVGYAYGGTVAGVGGAVISGTVYGRGGTKSDSVNVNLSRGEEVIQEPFASMYRPLLKQMNRGDFAPSQPIVLTQPQSTGSSSVQLTQVINPRPGMSESEVGRIAASRISDEVGRLL